MVKSLVRFVKSLRVFSKAHSLQTTENDVASMSCAFLSATIADLNSASEVALAMENTPAFMVIVPLYALDDLS